MKVIQVKCGSCGAGLDADEETSFVTCEYCGTKSRIQRRTGMFKLEQLVAKDVPLAVQAAPRAAKAIIVLSFVASSLVGVGVLVFFVLRLQTGGPGGGGGLGGSNPQWEGVGGALFADVNGDGVEDVVGRVRYVGDQDLVHLAAFDGRTGAPLWESEALGSYTDTFQGKASVIEQAVLFGSPQGELQAFSRADGKRLWRVPLGEQTKAFCAHEPGLVLVDTTDQRQHRLHAADGTAVQAEAGGNERPFVCPPLAHDRRDGDPHWETLRHRRPDIPGLAVRETFQMNGEGPALCLGNAEPGTRVPMVALLSPAGELLWKSEVPGLNRLKAKEGPPDLFASDGAHLFVLFEQRDHSAPPWLAAFGMDDGRRLWERTLETSMPTTAVQVSGDRVLVSSWGRLDAYLAADGQPAYTIGWSMK